MSVTPPALRSVLLALAALLAPGLIHAQAYPVKPVRMIIPFASDGNADIIGRVFAPKMSEFLGRVAGEA